MKKGIAKTLLILLNFALWMGGCASKPRFQPSAPVENTRTVQEALLLCDQYHAPPDAVRPIALAPYLDCVDDAAARHRDTAPEAFLAFRRELHSRYSSLSDSEWSPSVKREIELAIHALFRVLWSEGGWRPRVTEAEKKAVLRHFPILADRFAAESWSPHRVVFLDPELEAAKARLAALRKSKGDPVRTLSPSAVTQLCLQFAKIEDEVGYLHALWDDLSEMVRLDPRNEVRGRVEQKFRDRIRNVLLRLEELELGVEKAGAENVISRNVCLRGYS